MVTVFIDCDGGSRRSIVHGLAFALPDAIVQYPEVTRHQLEQAQHTLVSRHGCDSRQLRWRVEWDRPRLASRLP